MARTTIHTPLTHIPQSTHQMACPTLGTFQFSKTKSCTASCIKSADADPHRGSRPAEGLLNHAEEVNSVPSPHSPTRRYAAVTDSAALIRESLKQDEGTRGQRVEKSKRQVELMRKKNACRQGAAPSVDHGLISRCTRDQASSFF